MNKAIIADIGGTNARFSMVDKNGKNSKEKIFSSTLFFDNPEKTVKNYLNSIQEEIPSVGIFAIAGPVFGGRIDNRNIGFSWSIKEMGEKLKIKDFDIVNDFSAQALSIPYLTEKDYVRIGKKQKGLTLSPIAVIGPGTGLGAGILLPLSDGSYKAIPTEGGHVNAPFVCDKKIEKIINSVAEIYAEDGKRYLSCEDLVSGRGLPNLYAGVRKLKGKDYNSIPANPEITEMMVSGDNDAIETFDVFFSLLGIFAGNYAVSCGAVGGVYLTGGILMVPEIYKAFIKSDFRSRFENKGAVSSMLENIPTYLITHKNPAFLGLSSLAAERLAKINQK